MTSPRALLPAVAALTALFVLAGVARATPALDPFASRDGGKSGRPSPWDPLRTAQPQEPSAKAAKPDAAKPQAPQTCKADDDCPTGTICQDGTCRPIERRIHVLLFRKEGPKTMFMPFYFSRVGVPGYRVVAPFYWHFWSQDYKRFFIAPLYWHSVDHSTQAVTRFVFPFWWQTSPEDTRFFLAPLFLFGSTKIGWGALPLLTLSLHDDESKKSFGIYGLLYWKRRTLSSSFDLFFPLFVSKRSADSAFTFALPISFYWRSANDRSLLSIPFFYWNKHPNGSTLATLLGYRSTAEGGASRGALLWLYWWSRRSDSSYDVIFPLLWSVRSPDRNITVVPPLVHYQSGKSSLTTIFPAAWWSEDRAKGSSWRLFFPFFFARSRDHGQVSSWLTPLGGYSRDDTTRKRALTWILPPIISRRDPTRELDTYLLLYWHYRDVPNGVATQLFGPYYRRDDPTGATRALFPLFWYFRDAHTGATAHSLLPFYFRRSSPDEILTAAGPLFPFWFYHRRFTDGGRSFGLLPLAYFGHRKGHSHAVVLPLFYHFKDPRGSATVAFPFYYRLADAHGQDTGVPPLLYFQGGDESGRYYVQIPFFWRFVDHKTETRTTVVPPVFFRTRRDGWSAGLAPLLFFGGGGPRSHFVVFPLLWRMSDDHADRHTTVLANYMHRRHGGEVTDAFFPLLHYRRGAKPGRLDETSFTLFPLVHYRRDTKATLFLTPVASWSRTPTRKVGYVLPYFWYQSRVVAASGVPPLYFDITRLDTGERSRLFGLYFTIDAPGHKSRMLFPFYARYQNEKERGTYVFPTYFHRRTTDGYAVDTLFPLFWRSSWPGHATTVVGPFFRRSARDSGATGLIPLFVSIHNPKWRLFATPLFFSYANEQAKTGRTFALLYFRSTNPDGHRTVLFPLLWAGRHKEKSHAVVFPLFWRFANQKENKAFNVLFPFLWAHHGTERAWGVMPILWHSRDSAKESSSTALVPLFYWRGRQNQKLLVTPAFGFRTGADRKWWYAGPLYNRESWTDSLSILFPLWFSRFDKISETRTRVIPPLLHYSRSSPDKSISSTLLLFWRHRDITSSTTLGIPLFFDSHSYHESRWTVLMPLFLRHRNEVSQQTYTLAPLPFFYRRTGAHPDDKTTIWAPLVWDFKAPDHRTTLVLPFFVHWRRATHSSWLTLPTIYYRKGLGPEAGTYQFMFVPLWESAVKRPGDYMWEVLMGLFGWERIGRNRFLKVFFFHVELEPAPVAKTAWYGRPVRPTRPLPARGVNTQIW